jgi:hypothetical protein
MNDWPTQEEIDAATDEIFLKVRLADKIAAARPGQPQPSLPLSEQAEKTVRAILGWPDVDDT